MPASFETVKQQVRERVRPKADERQRLSATVDSILERTRSAVDHREVDAEVLHVGSTARDTWLSGELDIDVFVRFNPDLPRDALKRHGLAIGHAVLPDGREEYAEHPYVTGEVNGFAVDVVPCYAVESPRAMATSVDRTPFHTAYVRTRLDDTLADEVRLLKQFLLAIDAYGSDLETRGFSGYLVELLILEFGSAKGVFEAAIDWQPPVSIDPEGHGECDFDDPLIVIDPTDPTRNVAAVVAPDNVARLQHYSRELLAAPRVDLFFPDPPAPMNPSDVEAEIGRRGTTPMAVVFETPDLVTDQLSPQLEKSLEGISDALERFGFDILRQARFVDDQSVLLFELEVAERPAIERHLGPPVAARDHAERFLDAYADIEAVDGTAHAYGPFLDGDRYVVERERDVTDAATYLRSDAVFETRLGPAVEAALEEGYSVLVGPELADLAPPFGVELARYFDPRP